jgi:hypothetical protein
MGALTAGQAQALVVNVGGEDWDVTTFTGSYYANTSKFATAANGGVMPWWGNGDLATSFALRVNHSLSSHNDVGRLVGPRFAIQLRSTGAGITPGPEAKIKVGFRLFFELTESHDTLSEKTWAQAIPFTPPAPAAAPGPLPILGAAAAFGFSRKLRKRIKCITNTVSSGYSR